MSKRLELIDWQKTARDLLPQMQDLGSRLLQMRAQGLEKSLKADGTIVTNADLFADKFVSEILSGIGTGISYISEESLGNHLNPNSNSAYWCVDPVDATYDFVHGGDLFSINIALISNGLPLFGFLYFPALGLAYTGYKDTAYKISGSHDWQPLKTSAPQENLRLVVSSNSHGKQERLEPYLPGIAIASVKRMNGAIKFGYVAEGSFDLYPRLTKIHEWDVAAGHAILEAAGGKMTDLHGKDIIYGKSGDLAVPEFLAAGRSLAARLFNPNQR